MNEQYYEPAFPIPLHSEKCSCPCGNTGMTLRDYFAGQALMGLCAFTGGTEDIYPRRFNDGVANECYQIADAMLEARKK